MDDTNLKPLLEAQRAFDMGVMPSPEALKAVCKLLSTQLEKKRRGRPTLTNEELRRKMDGPIEVEDLVQKGMKYYEARSEASKNHATNPRDLQYYKKLGATLPTMGQPVPMQSWGCVGLVLPGATNRLAVTYRPPKKK